MRYWVEPGRSDSVRFPREGPFDQRFGYTDIPRFVERLSAQGYTVDRQARLSPALVRLIEDGYFPPYREKVRGGLSLRDCSGETLFAFSAPLRVYGQFSEVPKVVAQSLLFIENRELLDEENPRRNPAFEWQRLARALLGQTLKLVAAADHSPGGSTLATQIEKYRHSPDGLTGSPFEKYRQMFSASLRAYREGEDTRKHRQRVIVDYLNTVPLSASPGFGAVHGIGDGLRAWFGADFNTVNALLLEPLGKGERLLEQGLAYRQVLSLMVAQRRPSYYLSKEGQEALAGLTDRHLRLLHKEGVIPDELRDAALAARPTLEGGMDAAAPADLPLRKASNAVRTRLASALEIPRLYDLDRLDLEVVSTLDGHLQQAVGQMLRLLQQPEYAKSAGLLAEHLLERADPGKVHYSFTLYERSGGANRMRVQTDNFGQPFDINEGAKLELGSTAKLRTLATYLEVIAELHQRYSTWPAKALKAEEVDRRDRLTRWAIDHLMAAPDRSLDKMLDAALERRYSASPGEAFFTGGGLHTFENYKREDNARNPTVREALQDSINLSFIRILRDVVQYHIFRPPGEAARVLADPAHPVRERLLDRFIEGEGREFVQRFWNKYRGRGPQDVEVLLRTSARPSAEALAVVFRALHPEAGPEALAEYVRRHLPTVRVTDEQFAAMHERHREGGYSLQDRGYIARLHPLELWVALHLHRDPETSLARLVDASAGELQAAYAWLKRPNRKAGQDQRILTMLERDAFREIHARWKRLGYPFDQLVPSYATAIGSSGDRPSSLAELMGIISAGGQHLPSVRVEHLRFAGETPYETRMRYNQEPAEQVMAPEVAAALRSALVRVVEQGTARRLAGAFDGRKDAHVAVGGKTGTGDNRHETYARGGRVVGSRVVSRTATFVFFIGDRHFGVITAFVPGADAARYNFTSALPVQILKVLAPGIKPAIEGSGCHQREEPLLRRVKMASEDQPKQMH